MPRDTSYLRSHGHDPRGPGADERMDDLLRARERDIARARAMRAEGHSLYEIHLATGGSKGWLRTYAGITDRTQGRRPTMITKKPTTTHLRRCTGSARFGIEPHEAPVSEFPKQPSRKDGLGAMCTEHWRAYVKGLREARRAAKAADEGTIDSSSEEADAA